MGLHDLTENYAQHLVQAVLGVVVEDVVAVIDHIAAGVVLVVDPVGGGVLVEAVGGRGGCTAAIDDAGAVAGVVVVEGAVRGQVVQLIRVIDLGHLVGLVILVQVNPHAAGAGDGHVLAIADLVIGVGVLVLAGVRLVVDGQEPTGGIVAVRDPG